MLKIVLSATEESEPIELSLEHSLVSLSKWEAKHEKPFFGKESMTSEETIDYIRHMILDVEPPENLAGRLNETLIMSIKNYIDSKQTATWFQNEGPGKPSSEATTSELIYYWMIALKVPISCETWHLNRLMTLIKICGIKQAKPKQMDKRALSKQYKDLNAQRREQLGTNG